MENYKAYAPIVLRMGISLVLLWFGLNQIFNSDYFLGYAPDFAFNLPIQVSTLIVLNGIFETLVGGFLLAGLFTRIAAIVIAIHLLGIAISLGYNDIAIRDLGLSTAAVAIFLHGPDRWCFDKKLGIRRRKQ